MQDRRIEVIHQADNRICFKILSALSPLFASSCTTFGPVNASSSGLSANCQNSQIMSNTIQLVEQHLIKNLIRAMP